MANNLYLEIVSPEKVIFEGEIEMVEMPGKRGRFAILKGHAPLISSLSKGNIRVKALNSSEEQFDCESGYVECSDNKVSILLSA